MFIIEPLLQLPLRFDADTLAREIDALPREAWTDHPQDYKGNDAVRFVTVNGALTDDIGTPMAPTRWLDSCPYVKTVMGALGGVWGRCRLMRLAPGAVVPPHVDVDFYWRTHIRIHVPIITNPGVGFTARGETVHMAAGECWAFDTFSLHTVHNHGKEWRTHLVMDTIGGEGLAKLLSAARSSRPFPAITILPGTNMGPLAFEQQLGGPVMSPWELACHVAFLRSRATQTPLADAAFDRLDVFVAAWHGVWVQFHDPAEGVPMFGRLIASLGLDLSRLGDIRTIEFGNAVALPVVMAHLIPALIHADLLPQNKQAANMRAAQGRR